MQRFGPDFIWHGAPTGAGFLEAFGVFGVIALPLFLIGALAILALKGWALWLAARRGEKWWFIALLVINTIGILELVYIFLVAKRKDAKDEPITVIPEKTEGA